MIGVLGRLLRGVRADARRSPVEHTDLAGAETLVVTSADFVDGGPLPRSSAGKGVGDNQSPSLRWTGVPPGARELVLIIDDVDVPLPRPLLHTVALIDPALTGLDSGALHAETPGVRFVRADLANRGYAGPRPIPGHGPHRYSFHVLAIDRAIPKSATTSKAALDAARGHVLARATLTGTYERGSGRRR